MERVEGEVQLLPMRHRRQQVSNRARLVAFLQQVKAVAEALYDDLLMEQANMVQTNSRRVQTQEFPLTQQENNMADQQRYGYYYRTEEMNREMAKLEQENAEEQQRPLEAAKEVYGYGGYARRRYGYGK